MCRWMVVHTDRSVLVIVAVGQSRVQARSHRAPTYPATPYSMLLTRYSVWSCYTPVSQRSENGNEVCALRSLCSNVSHDSHGMYYLPGEAIQPSIKIVNMK